jgi:hypothetical protein
MLLLFLWRKGFALFSLSFLSISGNKIEKHYNGWFGLIWFGFVVQGN